MASGCDFGHWVAAGSRSAYIVAGQSNAYSLATVRIPNQYRAVELPGKGVDFFYHDCNRNHRQTWFTTLHSIDPASPGAPLMMALARNVDDLTVIVYAPCGSAISDIRPSGWFPGANPQSGQTYDLGHAAGLEAAADYAERRTKALRGQALRYEGMVWLQGENDANYPGQVEHYAVRLKNLFWRFRDRFGKELPIVTAPIRETGDEEKAINAAIRAVAERDGNVAIVESADLDWMDNDDGSPNVHYTNVGLIELAGRVVGALFPHPGQPDAPPEPGTPVAEIN